jgi:hypothetical protein
MVSRTAAPGTALAQRPEVELLNDLNDKAGEPAQSSSRVRFLGARAGAMMGFVLYRPSVRPAIKQPGALMQPTKLSTPPST